ncbi:hypothetical protein GCM10012275_57660 [Longimycelium tulufanense]|uniref:SseB protein N-terminal domain-containing protein n=1 Tax=Longimycelium tulufanense TaxID=907463 RepID=A0A8J3CK47_9PSEU|nr:SseB family protein [Longimycelium tulufanense]GGM79502.1 hypothetical protein GCM10012275_57660 [Longimycelium tulufanense]
MAAAAFARSRRSRTVEQFRRRAVLVIVSTDQRPLIYTARRRRWVIAYSTARLVHGTHRVAAMTGAVLLRRIPPTVGIVLDPGWPHQTILHRGRKPRRAAQPAPVRWAA